MEDSGPGVAPEIMSRIFEPFFTTKPPGEGTGLGLAVSLGLVQQQGGTISLDNRPRPGVGARFIVSMPVDQYAPTIALPPIDTRTAILPAPRKHADGSLAEVLLIDDEASVRASIARIFRRSGWPVREAANGADGLAWLLNATNGTVPALILCDLKMPGMGGREVHAHLSQRRPELLDRLILVTGDVVEPAMATFLATAGCEVVEKPFTLAEIAATVERVMRMQHV